MRHDFDTLQSKAGEELMSRSLKHFITWEKLTDTAMEQGEWCSNWHRGPEVLKGNDLLSIETSERSVLLKSLELSMCATWLIGSRQLQLQESLANNASFWSKWLSDCTENNREITVDRGTVQLGTCSIPAVHNFSIALLILFLYTFKYVFYSGAFFFG